MNKAITHLWTAVTILVLVACATSTHIEATKIEKRASVPTEIMQHPTTGDDPKALTSSVTINNTPDGADHPRTARPAAGEATTKGAVALSHPQDIMSQYHDGSLNKADAMQSLLMLQNEKSLATYGKLVDQYGMPVSGAKVGASVLRNVNFIKNAAKFYSADTDAEGRFSFPDIRGTHASFSFTKDGYFHSYDLAEAGNPPNLNPGPTNPVIFTIWKLRGPERLIHHDNMKEYYQIPDSRPYAYDLQKGVKVEQGVAAADIVVCVNRPLKVERSEPGLLRFDWSLRLAVPTGGVQEARPGYHFEAPETGYESALEVKFSKEDKSWSPRLDRNYYIKSREGQSYAIVNLKISAGRDDRVAIRIESWLNPAGSRNLEVDRNLLREASPK